MITCWVLLHAACKKRPASRDLQGDEGTNHPLNFTTSSCDAHAADCRQVANIYRLWRLTSSFPLQYSEHQSRGLPHSQAGSCWFHPLCVVAGWKDMAKSAVFITDRQFRRLKFVILWWLFYYFSYVSPQPRASWVDDIQLRFLYKCRCFYFTVLSQHRASPSLSLFLSERATVPLDSRLEALRPRTGPSSPLMWPSATFLARRPRQTPLQTGLLFWQNHKSIFFLLCLTKKGLNRNHND